MKHLIDNLDATPHKRFILSIVSDYDLTRSICELIDNAIDIWVKTEKKNKLNVQITFDLTQNTITIKDNSGGVKETDLSFLVSPGASTNTIESSTIGIFGVGTKRAVIALSQDIKIASRYKRNKTFQIEFDEEWLKDEDWSLPYYEVPSIDENSTIVNLQKLRIKIDVDIIEKLKIALSTIYAKFLGSRKFDIIINGITLRPILFENWAYPPEFEPRKFTGKIELDSKRIIEVSVTAGLTNESSPTSGEYGVYFYCNDRLIVKGLKTPEVGFIKGIAGLPHPSISITRIIISLKGSAYDMPWNSSKSDIDTNHHTFQVLRNWILEIVKNFTSLSRRLEGNWEENVFKYDEGEVKDIKIKDFNSVDRSYLIELPKVNIKYSDEVKFKNSNIAKTKPWTKGLYESVIAVNYIQKQKLETKNRISLLLLDSTLEIAFKEYLVNDCGKYYSDSDIAAIFKARHLVHNEIKKYISIKDITDDEWKRLKYYYDLRCKLVHERATVDITDTQLNDLMILNNKILKKLYKLKF